MIHRIFQEVRLKVMTYSEEDDINFKSISEEKVEESDSNSHSEKKHKKMDRLKQLLDLDYVNRTPLVDEEYVVESPNLYRKNVSPKRKILKTIYCHVYRLCCTKWKNGTSIWEMEGCSQ